MRSKQPAATRRFHPRNRHQGRYDFSALIAKCPDLARFLRQTPDGEDTLDFADPHAVRALNRALLSLHYGITGWDIPPGYLCPPIPGRADYLHALADLLAASHRNTVPTGNAIRVLDIGVGANCVYPLIGHAEYGWRFVGTEIDPRALQNVQTILDKNRTLTPFIELRRQASPQSIFDSIIRPDERFDLSLCNPPFHASRSEAAAGSTRKWQNLGKSAPGQRQPALNFGGHGSELWCPGGEEAFVRRMVMESARYAQQCLWFSSLVAKSASLPGIYRALKKAGAIEHHTIAMAQGQKQSRLVAWTFLDKPQQRDWCTQRWTA